MPSHSIMKLYDDKASAYDHSQSRKENTVVIPANATNDPDSSNHSQGHSDAGYDCDENGCTEDTTLAVLVAMRRWWSLTSHVAQRSFWHLFAQRLHRKLTSKVRRASVFLYLQDISMEEAQHLHVPPHFASSTLFILVLSSSLTA